MNREGGGECVRFHIFFLTYVRMYNIKFNCTCDVIEEINLKINRKLCTVYFLVLLKRFERKK